MIPKLTLLHSEGLKLHGVLALLSAIGLMPVHRALYLMYDQSSFFHFQRHYKQDGIYRINHIKRPRGGGCVVF